LPVHQQNRVQKTHLGRNARQRVSKSDAERHVRLQGGYNVVLNHFMPRRLQEVRSFERGLFDGRWLDEKSVQCCEKKNDTSRDWQIELLRSFHMV
jgi:hypothetical protein